MAERCATIVSRWRPRPFHDPLRDASVSNRIGPFTADLWVWAGPANWVFLSLPAELADTVRVAALLSPRGWGSVRVSAEAQGVCWETSLFPDRSSGSYILPVKASVRRRLGVSAGDSLTLALQLRDPG